MSWPVAHDAWSGDPEYGIKNLLARNLEHLSPAQFAKITGILQTDPAGQEIAAAWIGKENSAAGHLDQRGRDVGRSRWSRPSRDVN